MADKKELGIRIMKIRCANGMSQKELAEKAGTTSACISQCEQGKRNVRYSTLMHIADALGITVEELTNERDANATITPPRGILAKEEKWLSYYQSLSELGKTILIEQAQNLKNLGL